MSSLLNLDVFKKSNNDIQDNNETLSSNPIPIANEQDPPKRKRGRRKKREQQNNAVEILPNNNQQSSNTVSL